MDKDLVSQCTTFLIENNVNSFKLIEWQQLIEKTDFSIDMYEELIVYFATDEVQPTIIFASSNSDVKFISFLEEGIYHFLSSQKNRGTGEILITSIISSIIPSVASICSIDVSVLTGFANLIILGILKIGIDAWCKYYENKNK